MSDIEVDDLGLVDDLEGKELTRMDMCGQLNLSKAASAKSYTNLVIGKPHTRSLFLLRAGVGKS